MGYWGYYVVARSERPLGELTALSSVREVLQPLDRRRDGWQVWECPSPPGQQPQPEMGDMNSLARETGRPALFGYVMDSTCVVMEAAAPDSGTWTACLGREAIAARLGLGDPAAGHGSDGLTVDDYFLPPEEAADRAVGWSVEAGAQAVRARLLGLLRHEPEASAEHSFFRFLDRLGVMPF